MHMLPLRILLGNNKTESSHLPNLFKKTNTKKNNGINIA